MTAVDSVRHRTGRSLIPDEQFERLAGRITAEHGHVDRPLAERIVDQTLAFLAAAGPHSGKLLSPTEAVDIGWHTFILYTREYAEFCDRVANRFIHHVPHDDTPSGDTRQTDGSARALAAIRAAGYLADPDLWTVAAKCSQACSASGSDGNENTGSQLPPPTIDQCG